MPDGTERVWEMADVYADVARLPGMGADPAQRAAVYRQAGAALLAPAAGAPLNAETHGAWIKPQLVTPEGPSGVSAGSGLVRLPLEELGLVTVYVLDLPSGGRYLTEGDLAALGLDEAGVHRLALDNLGKAFPREMVSTALSGEGSAVQFNDSFDAARLLLIPDLLEEGQEVIALAPHRDMLLLVPAEQDPEMLREGLKQLGCEGHPALLDQPVQVTNQGFRLLA
jgi:hypothetical protein